MFGQRAAGRGVTMTCVSASTAATSAIPRAIAGCSRASFSAACCSWPAGRLAPAVPGHASRSGACSSRARFSACAACSRARFSACAACSRARLSAPPGRAQASRLRPDLAPASRRPGVLVSTPDRARVLLKLLQALLCEPLPGEGGVAFLQQRLLRRAAHCRVDPLLERTRAGIRLIEFSAAWTRNCASSRSPRSRCIAASARCCSICARAPRSSPGRDRRFGLSDQHGNDGVSDASACSGRSRSRAAA